MDNTLRNIEKRGLSLRRVNFFMAAASLLISGFFLFSVYRLAADYNDLRDTTQLHMELRDSTIELQAASDYLTEQARNFAMTGKRVYLDNYFEEAEITRRREKALERLGTSESTAAAYADLERAMAESVALMDTEYLSMRLTILAYGLEESEYPEPVRSVELPEEYRTLPSAEQLELARALVLDEAYGAKKATISANMKLCLEDLLAVMQERQTHGEQEVHRLIERLGFLVILLICLVLLRITLTSRLVIGPLLTGVLYIREGQPLPIRGAYEFRFLARTYNEMYRENKAQTEQLTYETEHDKLTGVLNRAGYDHLLETLDLSSTALLLVDVDRFKDVNDTRGHKAGDEALTRVADALRENFRSNDYICRIGGDEFAVVMKNTGPDRTKQIEDKIARINDKLRAPSENGPPLSISAGCAFGSSPNGSGALAKDADVALYCVKEHGRSGCAFFP